jgi:hypothetical protein
MSHGQINEPTTRKVLNRGWRPIRYRISTNKYGNQVGYGNLPAFDESKQAWLIERTSEYLLVRLVGEETNRRVPLTEERYMVDLAPGAGEPV